MKADTLYLLVVFAVVITGAFLFAMSPEGQSNLKFEAECKSRGGVVLHTRGGRQCIDPKVFR
jgi:hypothetical protein